MEGADLEQLEAEASRFFQHIELIVVCIGIEAFFAPQQEGVPALFVGTVDEGTTTSQVLLEQGGVVLLLFVSILFLLRSRSRKIAEKVVEVCVWECDVIVIKILLRFLGAVEKLGENS